MPDIAASVLARLKTKQSSVKKAFSFVCSSFARRNFCAGLKNPNTQKILC